MINHLESMEGNVISALRIFDYHKTIEFLYSVAGLTSNRSIGFQTMLLFFIWKSQKVICARIYPNTTVMPHRSKSFIEVPGGLKHYQQELINKDYKYNKPGLGKAP